MDQVVGWIVLLAVIFLFGYILPSLIAGSRDHRQTTTIVVLNVLLGWTVLGWCVLLAWALLGGGVPAVPVPTQPVPPLPAAEGAPRPIVPMAPFNPRRSSRIYRRVFAFLMLVTVMSGIVLYLQRNDLAADPALGPRVRAQAARWDIPVFPAWPLGAYKVQPGTLARRHGKGSDIAIHTTLQVVGTRPVGLPVLRVLLMSRHLDPVGQAITLHPRQYVGDPALADTDVLPPGTTLPVEFDLADPQGEAARYEIVVCIPAEENGLRCTHS